MNFKDYLIEKINAVDIKKPGFLALVGYIPLTTKRVKQLQGGKFKRQTVFHMTDTSFIQGVEKIQGTKKQISTFTNLNSANVIGTSDLLTQGHLIVELQGDIIISSPEDIFTTVDYAGRRWVRIRDIRSAIGGTSFTESKKKLLNLEDDIYDMTSKLIKKYGGRPGGEDDPKKELSKRDKALFIKDYIDAVNKLLDKNNINKILFEVLQKSGGPRSYIYDWNEVVVNNIKIKKIYVIEELFTGEIKHIRSILKNKKIPMEKAKKSKVFKIIKQNYNRTKK